MTTKKKTAKSTKNHEKTMEIQVNNMEKTVKKIKELEEKKKIENERKNRVNDKAESIKEDLKNQLISQNKFGKHFDDMVEDYIFLVKLKEDLQNDIKSNGMRYYTITGNGFETEKPNESVERVLKVNAQMLKILQDLDLKAPEENPEAGEGDDLL